MAGSDIKITEKDIDKAIASADFEKIDYCIDNLRDNIYKSNSEELKKAYISLWKERVILRFKEQIEKEVLTEFLPPVSEYSLKTVENVILMIAGAYTYDLDKWDDYILPYKSTYENLYKKHLIDSSEDLLLRVLNHLFELRKYLVNLENHPLVHKFNLHLFERFNSLIMNKQKELYQKALEIYTRVKPFIKDNLFNIEASIDLNKNLPKEYPDQSERMKKLWEYMCNPEFNSTLKESAHKLYVFREKFPSLNHFLYLCDYEDDWSHLLSGECGCHYLLPEIEKINNVGYILHNMTDHLNYSIHEIIYATEFKFSLNVEIEEMIQ